MKRYCAANGAIHAPEELKRNVVQQGAAGRSPRPRKGWIGAVAAVLAVAVLSGVVFWQGGLAPAASAAIVQAQYPDRAQQVELPAEDDMGPFYETTLREFLGDSGGENRVYSPLNLYLALAMLAELTDGNSRQQILDLLGAADMDSLRTLAHGLWNANYRDSKEVTSILASSLWLNENVTFVQDTMERLAEVYYASSYQGEMGSAELDRALQDWLNDQTGGLLKKYAGEIQLEPATVLALATTLYLRVRWNEEFYEGHNTQEDFATPGGTVTAEFMHGTTQNYYWGEGFSATYKSFLSGGEMWLILPDEGVSVDDLLDDPEAMEFFLTREDWTNQANPRVNLSLPKFDVSAQTDLTQGLQDLGVTDVFDPDLSDYSPMTTQVEEIYLSQAVHAARVAVDEEGVEAAAFTVMSNDAGAGPLEDEVDFVLDRPFLFLITSDAGQILFAGVVNHPNG